MKKFNEEIQHIINVAEDLGWTVQVEDETEDYIIFDFGKFSSAGQDFHFMAEAENHDAYNLIQSIYARYQDFDVSAEAYLWLDSDGHGKNGAPYDMKDVYEDMEECMNSIYELYEAI